MGYKNNIKKVRQYGQECVNLLNLLSFGFMFIFKKVTVEITFTCSDAKQKKKKHFCMVNSLEDVKLCR